ncbi:MAG: Uma2 family endonuclease [Tannerella sp.]|jgi:Uma2 family endonuclease|nr:Uma2 family endonuclease [Tannerella sp.]
MGVALDINKRYSYADYQNWMDGKVYELFDGIVKMMSPAPRARHQELIYEFCGEFRRIIKNHKGKCKVYPAPFDVRLPKNGEKEDKDIYTVVQPDLCVVCDLSKIDERGCLGAPDMIIEVQSFATAKHDLNEKFRLYECAGVREYWVVFPYENAILKFLIGEDGKYGEAERFEFDAEIEISTFAGEKIKLKDIFDNG